MSNQIKRGFINVRSITD